VAGIGSLPGIREQIALVARLRWNLFRNSLRTLKGRLEAVSIGIVWLMMSGLILGGGAAMGIVSYVLVTHGLEQWLPILFWIVFLYWQLNPLFSSAIGVQFDFSNLLRFPVRFGSFLALSLAYGVFEPGAVGAIFWLFCMAVGVGFARPEIFFWALLVVAVFAAMNLLLARMILSWADRWLAQRKTREILGFIFILIIIGFQFIGPVVERLQHRHTRLPGNWIPSVLSVASFLPPGFAGKALLRGLGGSFLPALFSLFLLCVYALIFFWLLRIRLVALYRGELISETRAVARPAISEGAGRREKRALRTSWHIPLVSGAIAAVFEKEMRYARRNAAMLLALVIPILFIFVFGLNLQNAHNAKDVEFMHRSRILAFPIATAYTFLVQLNFVFNSFAYEGTGVQFLFLSPVRFRDILAGKNLFLALVSFLETLVVWVCVTWMFGIPQVAMVTATVTALVFATLSNFAVGNFLSVCFPRKFAFGTFRQKRMAGVTMAAGMATEVGLLGICALVFVLALALGHPWIATPIFLILAVAAAVGYVFSLSRMDQFALNHRETLTAELCRAE
jgi:ABC-2 type transport system permease protein